MPEPSAPIAVFDRDRLTVTVAGVEIALRAIQPGPDAWQALNAKLLAVPPEQKAAAFDAIEQAAWEVFASRRWSREAFTDGDPESFDLFSMLDRGFTFDWEVGTYSHPSDASAPSIPAVRPLFQIEGDTSGKDELIEYGYLERGGSLLIAGQTGIGKSSLSLQLAVGWALGRETLGFTPSKRLASLIVQAENGDNDLVKMRRGVAAGFSLDKYQEAIVNARVAVARVDEHTGFRFGEELTRLIRQWSPDVVFLDPLLSFVGGDISKQEVASEFLRKVLQPSVRRAKIGLVISHHTGKPSKDPREADQQTDYLALGSSELANWPRAIIGIRRDKTRGLFRLDLGKRGQNLEWTDETGERVYSKMIRHSPGGIFWVEISPEQEAAATVSAVPTKEALFNLVPATGTISKDSLIARAGELGIGEKKANGWLSILTDEKRLHIWMIPRPRTNKARHVSRQPQPPEPSPTLDIPNA